MLMGALQQQFKFTGFAHLPKEKIGRIVNPGRKELLLEYEGSAK